MRKRFCVTIDNHADAICIHVECWAAESCLFCSGFSSPRSLFCQTQLVMLQLETLYMRHFMHCFWQCLFDEAMKPSVIFTRFAMNEHSFDLSVLRWMPRTNNYHWCWIRLCNYTFSQFTHFWSLCTIHVYTQLHKMQISLRKPAVAENLCHHVSFMSIVGHFHS